MLLEAATMMSNILQSKYQTDNKTH